MQENVTAIRSCEIPVRLWSFVTFLPFALDLKARKTLIKTKKLTARMRHIGINRDPYAAQLEMMQLEKETLRAKNELNNSK